MAVTTGRPELADALDRLWPGYQSVLAGLIRIPSLLGDEAAAQRYLAAAAADAGMDVELWDVNPGELGADPDYAVADGGAVVRPNVTAVLPGTGGGGGPTGGRRGSGGPRRARPGGGRRPP